MRFLFISNYGLETHTSYQNILIRALQEAGHTVDHLYPRNGPILNQVWDKQVKPPDAVIYMEGLLFENPRWLKLPIKIPKIWYFLDTPVLFNEQVMWYNITDADLALVRDRREISRFEERGIKCVWAPPKINPKTFHIYPCERRDIDIGFVGYVNESRARWLDDFTVISNSVHGYGDGVKTWSWQETFNNHTYQQKLPHREFAEIYSRTKICPHRTGRYENTRTKGEGVQGDITWRPFEATACGAMLLTEEFDAIDDLFVREKEIVVYDMNNDPRDRVELAKYYLEHNEEREKIAQAGYDRTHKDHTWSSMINLIIDEVKKI